MELIEQVFILVVTCAGITIASGTFARIKEEF